MLLSRWWFWLLIVVLVVFLALLIWWLLRRRTAEPTAKPEVVVRPPEPPAATITPVAVERPAPVVTLPPAPMPDDLARIEGIGPKISGILQAAGITTFAQLAATDVSWVTHILQEAGIRLADPTTWAEQARLAAADDWEGLEALQKQLKGGRRV